MPHSFPTRHFIILIIALVLGACATVPKEDVTAPPGETELLRQAERALADGEYELAGRYFLEAAGIADEAQQPGYQLQAVAALLRGNHISRAQRVLDIVDRDLLDPVDLLHWQAATARIALAQNRPEEALNTLPAATDDMAPAALRADIHELRAEAQRRTGNHLEAARERVLREAFLDPADAPGIAANQQIIWQMMNLLPDDKLRDQIAPPPDTLDGWRELTLIARSTQTGAVDIAAMIDNWQQRYPAHPASSEIIDAVLTRQREEAERPARIAVLLPLTGPVADSAGALRDGFIAAHYHRDNRAYAPTIRFYDTGPNPAEARSVYDQAVADGADFIVGPLTRQAVNLIASGRISIPTLTLNYTETDDRSDPRLYQFGLAPEDEARQVAQRAWLDGHNHALAIVPDGEWGRRVAEAFDDEWSRYGGKLLDTRTYPSDINDFSDQIKRMLNLDESEQRHRDLVRTLRQPLQFEPRRRHDADFIFMAAFPRQARLIRPQLEFHYAGQLPVYSTSHVYAGHPNRSEDRDINGVIFCDLPWVLTANGQPVRKEIEQVWAERSTQYVRFYALGVDAYDIIPYLNNLRLFHYERFQGATGMLQLTDTNRVYRQLPWARFTNGLPRPYN